MWTRIVGALVAFIVITFAIQWLLPRNAREGRVNARQYLIWDIVPLVAFFGILLLVLSVVEAERLGNLLVWGWGGALGLVAGIGVRLSLAYGWHAPTAAAKREPVWRLGWRLIRTFGPALLVILVALNLLTRWLGSVVEVFVAGAFGVCIVVITLLLLIEALRRNASVKVNEQRERNGK